MKNFLQNFRGILLGLSFVWLSLGSVVSATELIFSNEEPNWDGAGTFTLDTADEFNDIELEFANSVDASIGFDRVSDNFEINRNVDFEGNELINFSAENLNAAPTCDGTAIGRIYFNTTTGLTYACNGTVFLPLENILLTDADGDTLVQVEESANENIIRFDTAGAERMVIDASGNVGIGVLSPSASLDLAAATASQASLQINTGVQPTTPDTGDVYSDGTDIFFYNGTTWDDLTPTPEAELPVVQGRRTTNFTMLFQGTFYDVDLDTTDVENNSAELDHDDTNRDRINIGSDGMYMIHYEVTPNDPLFTHTLDGRVRLNDTTVMAGSLSEQINFQNEHGVSAITFFASLTAGDFITLQVARQSSNLVVNETKFSAVKLQGSKGEKGDKGLPGSVGLGTDSATFTFDQDNVGGGADVDLVAEQGTDSDGTLRYNATDNQWELSNDGGAFSAIAVSPPVAQVYESGTTTFDAVTPIDWDGASATARIVDGDYAHSTVTNPSQVTVNNTGLYEVAYAVSWDTTVNARRTALCQFYVNGTLVTPNIGSSYAYARNNVDSMETNSAEFLYNFTAADYYEIQCSSVGTAGSITTLADQSWTNIKRVR